MQWLPVCWMSAAILFGSGCESITGDTGLGVLPPDDLLELIATDTTTIQLQTRVVDSIHTGDAELQLFGNYIDPVFGRLSATTFLQVVPGEGLTFEGPDALLFDSLVLSLNIFDSYGRLETPQKVRIFEISEDFPSDEQLVSNHPLSTFSTNLCHPDNAHGCVLNFAQSGLGTVRIRLEDQLGMRLLNAPTSTLQDFEVFSRFFKGLAITTEDVTYLSREPGAIFRLFSNSSETNLTLYYRQVTNNDTTASTETFLISNAGKKYHTIKRTEYENKLLGRTLSTNSHMYHFLQGGGLIELYGKFPGLAGLPVLGVNKAELVLKVDDAFFGSETENGHRYPQPPQLLLLFVEDDGSLRTPAISELADLRPEYNSTGQSYTFRMTPYVQRLMRGKEKNNGFVIRPVIPNSNTVINDNMNRVVLGGAAHPLRKPELNLIYTAPKQ